MTLPPRGSIQDYVLQKAVADEEVMEIARMRLLSLSAYKQGESAQEFNRIVSKAWDTFFTVATGENPRAKEEEAEARLMKYYKDVVSKSKLTARRSEKGLTVDGYEILLKND